MVCVLLADGSRVDGGNLIGNGMDGLIIRTGCHAFKIPHLYGRRLPDGTIEPHEDNWLNLGHLDNEKQVYERLCDVPGIAECIETTSNGILLEYYRNGSLADYLASHEPPPIPLRWDWVLQATELIARCHEKRVLVFDIALRNFVLADDFTLRIIDFNNSELLPLSADVTEANVDGFTARVDLLHLSNVIYSVMSWKKFSIDCAFEAEWPADDQMPNTEGLGYGNIVRKCWSREYSDIQELSLELRLCAQASSSIARLECPTPSSASAATTVQCA